MQHIRVSEDQLAGYQVIRLIPDILVADIPLGPELVAEGLPTGILMC